MIQRELLLTIERHPDVLRASIKEMGCKGRCLSCPGPETDGDAALQGVLCLTSAMDVLNLKPPTSVEIAQVFLERTS